MLEIGFSSVGPAIPEHREGREGVLPENHLVGAKPTLRVRRNPDGMGNGRKRHVPVPWHVSHHYSELLIYDSVDPLAAPVSLRPPPTRSEVGAAGQPYKRRDRRAPELPALVGQELSEKPIARDPVVEHSSSHCLGTLILDGAKLDPPRKRVHHNKDKLISYIP